MIFLTAGQGKLGGHPGLGWPLVFSIVVHVAIVLTPIPRGQWTGQSNVPPDSSPSPSPLPLTVAFRSALSPPEHPVALDPLAVDEAAQSQTTAAPENTNSPTLVPDISSTTEIVGESREYLPPERLTRLPEVLNLGNLDLPGVVQPNDKGRLVLEILISDEGNPDSIRVVETSVPAAFLANALRVFHWARYTPGRELNRAVRSRIRVEIVLGDMASGVAPRNGSTTVLKKFDSVPP